MASAKKDTKDKSAQWKKEKAEKYQAFAAAFQLQNKKIGLVKKMRMTRTTRFL
jgi:hypothetical protein